MRTRFGLSKGTVTSVTSGFNTFVISTFSAEPESGVKYDQRLVPFSVGSKIRLLTHNFCSFTDSSISRTLLLYQLFHWSRIRCQTWPGSTSVSGASQIAYLAAVRRDWMKVWFGGVTLVTVSPWLFQLAGGIDAGVTPTSPFGNWLFPPASSPPAVRRYLHHRSTDRIRTPNLSVSDPTP